ncbi:alpha carbonic anhydrase [Cercophora newfieldiana]|uniref:Carbonic anhydrase n=1 Tax=Cercophora newfieldiana TaxID=92897 RepID=A0AA39YLU3_9PEZI|nr:alpha carbonic anhydrase [Cercophora newfieldiana]
MARFIVILSLLSGAFAHEHHGTTLFPRAEQIAAPKFGYHGLTGPLNWFNLNQTTNELCAKGTHQSPIDLSQSFLMTSASANPQFALSAAPRGADFINLGTTVEVMGANGTLVTKNKTSKLAQFHFHSPSEHSINGVFYPMEVHFVFQAPDASLSVVGFVIDIGGSNFEPLGTLATSLKDIPRHGNETTTKPLTFDRLERHFKQYGTYQYSGSLTTPPCSEGVSWTVSTKPLQVDFKAFNAFKEVLKFNARYTQNTPDDVNLLQNIANTLH